MTESVADQDPRDASRLAAAERDASRRSGATLRVCAWCNGPIPAAVRRDAVCCSVRCRQARHRFNRAAGHAGAVATGRALRLLAYADPPYPGNARLYRDHPDYRGEVDHAALIRRLADEYDGWALSTSAAALPAVLALCPPGVRVAAWRRGERPTVSRWPLSAWEPVIYCGGRPDDPSASRPARRVDSLVNGVSPLTTLPGRVTGTKPAAFCHWVFELLGAAPGDVLDDLFPGSGVVARAWAAYSAEPDTSRAARARHDAPGERDASAEVLGDASRPTSGATAASQLELFVSAVAPKLGPRGFPVCAVCDSSEGIGPACALCTRCWSPERDPVGGASWDDIEAAQWWQTARKRVETVRVLPGLLGGLVSSNLSDIRTGSSPDPNAIRLPPARPESREC